ncbi:MAG: hypothetical protein U1F36_04815 [Planctomycetota bacterium]
MRRPDGEPNSTVKLAQAIQVLWPEDAIELRDQSDAMLFLDPMTAGGRQIERTVQMKPALVVALDFPFWFGYGQFSAATADKRTAARLERQDQCFGFLEQVLAGGPVPILIGDYPDMHGADPQMLPPGLIPSVEELRTLNGRLRDWVAKHPTVTLFPLANFVEEARGAGIAMDFEKAEHRFTPELLMQSDRLHASRTGVAVLALRLTAALRRVLDAKNPLRPRDVTFAELVERCGATFEIEDWIDAQAKAPKKEDGAAERKKQLVPR